MNEVDILGIDLGTTNSAIAIWEPDTGLSRVLHNQESDRITPSVVMFDPQTGEPPCQPFSPGGNALEAMGDG